MITINQINAHHKNVSDKLKLQSLYDEVKRINADLAYTHKAEINPESKAKRIKGYENSLAERGGEIDRLKKDITVYNKLYNNISV